MKTAPLDISFERRPRKSCAEPDTSRLLFHRVNNSAKRSWDPPDHSGALGKVVEEEDRLVRQRSLFARQDIHWPRVHEGRSTGALVRRAGRTAQSNHRTERPGA